MDTSLAGRSALVGGSTQGIGRAAAIELAALGARVTLIARDEARLKAVAAELPTPAGQRHGYLVADFSQPETVSKAVGAAVSAPGAAFHVLVNNTGGPKGGPAHAATPEEYLAAFRMHVVCNQILVQAVLPGMKEAKYGRIVNILSTSVKAPIPDLGVSNTIRAAVANWAKTLAGELGPFGITVNNVLPGFTDTARLAELFKNKAAKTGKTLEQVREEAIATIPARRLGRPEEIAATVAFLATPAAAYINGTNVTVDGGRTPTL
jgi:3-oxoacyl-[acyl-carrier protein] reductase